MISHDAPHRPRFLAVLLILLILLVPGAWATQEPAGPWLERMMAAFREHTYQGTLLYAHGDHMRTLKILHDGSSGVEREKLTELEGGVREVLREGDLVTCLLPAEGTGKSGYCPQTGPFSRAFFQDFSRVGESYRFEVSGQGRVAGHDAVEVSITPIDSQRYAYQLWLDRESAMLLRCLLKDAGGKVLERFQFTEIVIGGEIPEEQFRLGEGEVTHHHLDLVEKRMPAGARHWRLAWMPKGFQEVQSVPAHAAQSGARLFSDGLAVISVFVEQTEQPMPQKISRMGATVAVSRTLKGGGKDWLVTVVGEVPAETARRMAQSVSLVSP